MIFISQKKKLAMQVLSKWKEMFLLDWGMRGKLQAAQREGHIRGDSQQEGRKPAPHPPVTPAVSLCFPQSS